MEEDVCEGDYQCFVPVRFGKDLIYFYQDQIQYHYMSLVTRKPVFRVSNQVRHKPACTATEASLEISDMETRDNILSRQ